MRRETGKRGEIAIVQMCKIKSETCFAVVMLQRENYILSLFLALLSDTKHRFSSNGGATRPDQTRLRTNIQVFDWLFSSSHLSPSVRLWTGSLVAVTTRLMASTVPRKAWGQTKSDPARMFRKKAGQTQTFR